MIDEKYKENYSLRTPKTKQNQKTLQTPINV